MTFANNIIKLPNTGKPGAIDTKKCISPEKRLSKRIYFKSYVGFGLQWCNYKAMSFNLSVTGIGILSNKVFPISTRLFIRIHISNYTILCEGIVARLHEDRIKAKTRMGIKFISRTDEIREMYNYLPVKSKTKLMNGSVNF